jgi:hypothetical protein
MSIHGTAIGGITAVFVAASPVARAQDAVSTAVPNISPSAFAFTYQAMGPVPVYTAYKDKVDTTYRDRHGQVRHSQKTVTKYKQTGTRQALLTHIVNAAAEHREITNEKTGDRQPVDILYLPQVLPPATKVLIQTHLPADNFVDARRTTFPVSSDVNANAVAIKYPDKNRALTYLLAPEGCVITEVFRNPASKSGAAGPYYPEATKYNFVRVGIACAEPAPAQ